MADITIPSATLVDWLADRRVLKKQWRLKLQALQSKVAEAAKKLPEPLQNEFKGEIFYQAARAVEERLRDTEQPSMLSFGRGESSVWSKILKAYERENLHLGEAALALVRNGEFEIPFQKSRVVKDQQQLVDLEKREGEYRKSVSESQKAYYQECQDLGVEGDDVEKELRKLAENLPSLVEAAAARLQSPIIHQAVEYYEAFTAFTTQEDGNSSTRTVGLLPLLSHELSPAILRLHIPEGSGQEASQTGGEEVHGKLTSPQNDQSQINWDFDDSLAEVAADDVQKASNDGVLSRIEGARNAIVLELSELKAFFRLRSSEIKSSTYAAITTSVPETGQRTGNAGTESMLAAVVECLAAYTSEDLKQLIALGYSKRYFDRTVSALQRQASQQSKYYRLQKEVEVKKRDAQAKLVSDAAVLNSLISSTSQLKMDTERQLEALLKAGKVCITGISS